MNFHLSDMLILEQLKSGQKRPAAIIKGIMAKFEVDYKPSTGMIYPALERLEKAGYIKKLEGYSITADGIEYLHSNEAAYSKMVSLFLYNKLFFKNLRSAIKNMYNAIKDADRNFIESNQEEIVNEINAITEMINKHKGD
ncbi:MAG: PadR family transcriptional regulator [Ferroplasma sp.]